MAKTSKRKYIFDAPPAIPAVAGDPAGVANRDLWIETGSGKLAFRNGGSTVLIPLASEITAAGPTNEDIRNVVGALIQDNAVFDWTYDAGADSLVGVIKDNQVTNAILADVPTATMKGRVAGGTGDPTDLTTAQVKTLLAIVAADISDFVATARGAITVTDTATADLTYSAGNLQVAVLDSPTVGGQTAAQIQTAVIAAISNGASAAYDTLLEIQNLLQADDTADALIVSAMAIRSRFIGIVVPNGASTATLTHSLNLTNIHDFILRVIVSATGVEEEYEAVGASANAITLTDETGSNIAAGRRAFIVAGA